jgi:hypothetical protein
MNYLYFVQQLGGEKCIKIGTARNVAKRLLQLKTGSPYDLCVLKSVPGNCLQERMMHIKFSKYRMNGEWFYPAEELVNFINSCSSQYYKELDYTVEYIPVPARVITETKFSHICEHSRVRAYCFKCREQKKGDLPADRSPLYDTGVR